MKRSITGFHQDEESHWVAELDCGHNQHVRHSPPFTLREWTQSAEGRSGYIGEALDCKRCEQLELPDHWAAYKETPEFNESTVPAGLLRNHTTKAGVWGRIVVLEGALDYLVDPPVSQNLLLVPGVDGMVPPQQPHRVAPRGAVRFKVIFLRRPG